MASDKTAAYLEDVLSCVRWKKARAPIRRELADHIEDVRQGFLQAGMGEDEAAALAVREMGDAAEVGGQLNASYRPAAHWGVWIPFALLLAAGLLVRGYIGGETQEPALLLFLLAALAGASFVPLDKLAKWAWPGYALLCLAMLGIAWAGQGLGSNGSFVFIFGRMMSLVYPALFLPLAYALLLYRMRGRGAGAILLLYACLAPPVLILTDVSSISAPAMVCAVCVLLTLYAALAGWFGAGRRMAVAAVAVVPVFVIVLMLVLLLVTGPYRMARLEVVFRPETDPMGAGFYGTAVKQLLAQTNLIGPLDPSRLTGNALAVYSHPGSLLSSDFILTLLAVRLGRAAFAAAVLLLCIFLLGALRACLRQRSMLGRLLALCVILTFAAQCAGYILGNIGVVLFMAYPLPLLGIGNASLLCNLLLCGLLLSTLRNGALLDDAAPPSPGGNERRASKPARVTP